MKTSELITLECRRIEKLLHSKNSAYGDSALKPTSIFSSLNSIEAIKIRLDDKLTRIRNKGFSDDTEDTVDDLIGYLILLNIARKNSLTQNKNLKKNEHSKRTRKKHRTPSSKRRSFSKRSKSLVKRQRS